MKKETNVKRRFFRTGSILPLAVIIVVILAIVGLSLLSMGRHTRVFAARTVADLSARLCADAGMTRSLGEMEVILRDDPTKLINATLPSATETSLDGCYGKYSFACTKEGTTLKDGFLLHSTGKSGASQRDVYAKIVTKSVFNNAISVKGSIEIKNSAEFGTWPDANVPIIIQTNLSSGSEGKVVLKNGVTIPGNLIIGPGGDIDDVVEIKGSSSVEGETFASIEEVQFPSVEAPTGLPYSGNIAGSKNILTSAQYDSISLGNSDVLTVSGNVTLYVTGDIVLGQSSSIIIEEGSSLELYLGGDLEDKNSSGIEYDSTAAPDATSFKLYGLDSCESIVLKAKSEFAGSIYAPEADIDLRNGGDIYGSISGNSLVMHNGGNFYYDTRLGELFYPPTLYFSVVRWWED